MAARSACIAPASKPACVSSSSRRAGAAYGCAADLPAPVAKDFPLRPHPDFPYAAHKAKIEHWLAAQAGGPRRLVLRLCTVLALRGHDSPFCFVHVDGVAGAIAHALAHEADGVCNVSGDGWMTLAEIAAALGKPLLRLPPGLLRGALRAAHALGLGGHAAGQVDFLAYRPVPDNTRLKTVFGYTPRYDSRAAFAAWRTG